ncbi:MAG TPA: glycosyltransferase family 39 protein [Candidatus Saccharimonadales bacterium]|nr:glycosyltransferase family 39 protein [Candidatus Saccharimonadales bacterium]
MKPSVLQQLILYRYRYWLAYSVLIAGTVFLLTFGLTRVAPGISAAGRQSVMTSYYWAWPHLRSGFDAVSLPYILLQKASVSLLGLSVLADRLPGVLIGLVTTFLFFLFMRELHKPHVSVLATVLFATSDWFLAIARRGTPVSMIPLVWILVFYSALQLMRLKESLVWGAFFGFAMVLALYTPYGIWAVVAGLLTLLIHPEIRRRVSVFPGPSRALGILIFVVLLLPLSWSLYKDPSQAWELAGLSSHLPHITTFLNNIWQTLRAITWYAPIDNAYRLDHLPLLDIGSLALLIAGLYQIVRDRHSVRTQLLGVSLILILIVTNLNPMTHDYALYLIPVFIIMASGITVLVNHWYSLFPRNPYARTFGLIPIALLFLFIVNYHYERYFVAWANAPATYGVYSNDLTLVNEQIKEHPNLLIISQPQNVSFYTILSRTHPGVQVVTSTSSAPSGPFLLDNGLNPLPSFPGDTYTPIVNDDIHGALRFWLIQPTPKES